MPTKAPRSADHTQTPRSDRTRTHQSDQSQRRPESSDSGFPPSQRDLYLHPGAESLSPQHLSDTQLMPPPERPSRDIHPTRPPGNLPLRHGYEPPSLSSSNTRPPDLGRSPYRGRQRPSYSPASDQGTTSFGPTAENRPSQSLEYTPTRQSPSDSRDLFELHAPASRSSDRGSDPSQHLKLSRSNTLDAHPRAYGADPTTWHEPQGYPAGSYSDVHALGQGPSFHVISAAYAPYLRGPGHIVSPDTHSSLPAYPAQDPHPPDTSGDSYPRSSRHQRQPDRPAHGFHGDERRQAPRRNFGPSRLPHTPSDSGRTPPDSRTPPQDDQLRHPSSYQNTGQEARDLFRHPHEQFSGVQPRTARPSPTPDTRSSTRRDKRPRPKSSEITPDRYGPGPETSDRGNYPQNLPSLSDALLFNPLNTPRLPTRSLQPSTTDMPPPGRSYRPEPPSYALPGDRLTLSQEVTGPPSEMPQRINYNDLRHDENKFRQETGLTSQQFEQLIPHFSLNEPYRSRYDRLPKVEDRLLFILVHTNTKRKQAELGPRFGMTQGRTSTWINILRPILQTTAEDLRTSPHTQERDLGQLLDYLLELPGKSHGATQADLAADFPAQYDAHPEFTQKQHTEHWNTTHPEDKQTTQPTIGTFMRKNGLKTPLQIEEENNLRIRETWQGPQP